MKSKIIILILLLTGCTQPSPRNLQHRYRLAGGGYHEAMADNQVWLHKQLVGVDSRELYDFFRFSPTGQVFHSSGIPEDSLAVRYNEFSKGEWGRYETSGDSLTMEIWMNLYDKFIEYDGYFKGDSLILYSARQRGFFKAKRKKFYYGYARHEVPDLQAIPEIDNNK